MPFLNAKTKKGKKVQATITEIETVIDSGGTYYTFKDTDENLYYSYNFSYWRIDTVPFIMQGDKYPKMRSTKSP